MSQFIKYNFLYLLLLPCIYFWLLVLFTSTAYILYFLVLSLLTFFLYKNQNYLDNTKLFYYSVYWIVLYLLSLYMEDDLYDVYIDYDFSFILPYMPLSVVFSLSFLHVFILFLLGYNTKHR